MELDILFIDPPGRNGHVPNNGLAYICANLKQHGLRTKVVDLNMKQKNQDRYLEYIDKCRLVGVSVKGHVLHAALNIVKQIKLHSFTIPVVLGGPQITVVGEKILKENPFVDYGLKGDAEYALLDLYNSLNIPDKSNISGLIWRRNGRIISNPYDFIKNLDKLPFPDYAEFDSVDIIELGFKKNIAKIIYPIVTSRGCPYQCIYCSVGKIKGRIFRARTPENCIEELIYAQDKYGIERFQVLDDTFTQDMTRASKFCELLINRKLNLKWTCGNGIRADRLDLNLAKLMKQSGCYHIAFGVESTDPEILDKVNKKISLEKIEQAIKIIKNVGIEPHAYFIVGLPGANFEKDLKSLVWSKNVGVAASFWMLVPYEGTPLWELKSGRMLMDYTRGTHYGPDIKVVYETDDYPAKDRQEFFYLANFLAGTWIISMSFPGGKSKLIFYLLRKSFPRSIGLKIDISKAIINKFVIPGSREILGKLLGLIGLKEPIKNILKKIGWI